MVRWRLIHDWPYYVSDTGLVRRFGKSRPLTPMMCGQHNKQYATVRLCCGGEYIDRKVHVLVLEAFVGPRPTDLKALHRDDNKANNNLENLYWGSSGENAIDCVLNGDGLSVEVVRAIKAHPKHRGSGRELARRYGISEQLVCDIRKGRCYSYVSIT